MTRKANVKSRSRARATKFSQAKSSVSSKKYSVTKRNKRLRKGIHNYLELNEESKYKRIFKNIITFTFLSALFVSTIFILFLIGITNTYSKDLPDIDGKFKESEKQYKESVIVDRKGRELYRLRGDKIKEEVSIDQIPVKLQWAYLATEDAQFWGHKGLNLLGVSRSTICIIKSKDTSSCGGGSSVTQQLVKITTGESDKTVDRKAKEAIMAMRVEQKYSKKQILEYYLNNVPEGGIIYGVKAGSKYIFGKEDLHDLSLAEMAYLASITNEPTTLSPWGGSSFNPQKSQERATYVLDRMLQEKKFTGVTAEEIKQAKEEIPHVQFKSKDVPKKAPHYVDYIIDELDKMYADKAEKGQSGSDYLRDKGYKIVAAVDLDTQELLENNIKTQIKTSDFQRVIRAQNAAGVVMDPKTGDILAMVGSRDFYEPSEDPRFSPEHNAALEPRGLGSTMKPALYLTAFRMGYDPATMLPDKRIDLRTPGAVQPYFTENYSRQYGQYGSTLTMRTALKFSLNVPAVVTYHLVGRDNYIDTYQKLNGYENIKKAVVGPSSVLGAANIPLIEQVHAYNTLAAEGNYHPKRFILQINDNDGKVVYDNTEVKGKQVIDKKYIFLINDMNQKYWLFDKGLSYSDDLLKRIGQQQMDIGGKTGTSDNGSGKPSDLAFMAYTPTMTMGIWAGNSCGGERCPLEGTEPTGESLYKYMFKQFLTSYLPKIEPARFSVPSGVQKGGKCVYYNNVDNNVSVSPSPKQDDKPEDKETNNTTIITGGKCDSYNSAGDWYVVPPYDTSLGSKRKLPW